VCAAVAASIIARRTIMKIWTAPEVREQNVGLEVTSYLPADIDLV
jgi:coenzyme PQQ precursor peptide PqqA